MLWYWCIIIGKPHENNSLGAKGRYENREGLQADTCIISARSLSSKKTNGNNAEETKQREPEDGSTMTKSCEREPKKKKSLGRSRTIMIQYTHTHSTVSTINTVCVVIFT